MRKLKFKKQIIRKRAITSTPESVNVEGIQLNQCTNNSKLVIENNPDLDLKYVEGILMFEEAKVFKAQAHAWCKLEDIYFDPTAEKLEAALGDIEIPIKTYFPYLELEAKNIPEIYGRVIPFSDQSEDFLKYFINKYPAK